MAVKARGGLAIVQDPKDAFCPDMPRSALEFVRVDYCVPLAELGGLLERLTAAPLPEREAPPPPSARLKEEVKTMSHSAGVKSDPQAVGTPSYFSCPDCGGVLFEMDEQGLLRYRCRVGHGYTAKALSVQQQTALDGALWAALRALEESASLARRMASRARDRNHSHTAERYEERAEATQTRAELARNMLLGETARFPTIPEEEPPGGGSSG